MHQKIVASRDFKKKKSRLKKQKYKYKQLKNIQHLYTQNTKRKRKGQKSLNISSICQEEKKTLEKEKGKY